MLVHVICRGNVLRSVIAEAYLNALRIPGITAISSGTVADIHRDRNAPNLPRIRKLLRRHGVAEFAKPVSGEQLTQQRLDTGNVTVCVNQIVHEEVCSLFTPAGALVIWDVADIGEAGRIPRNERDFDRYLELVYGELTRHVDVLVAELARAGGRLDGGRGGSSGS
jgi:protein-tyrosine-phosphatase